MDTELHVCKVDRCGEAAYHDLAWTGLHAPAKVCAFHYTYPEEA